MARFGQIPPYGKYFRRESIPYSRVFAGRRYVLKVNGQYGVISDKTSKRWFVYFQDSIIKGQYPNFRSAMAYLMPVNHDTDESYKARIRKITVLPEAREMNARAQEAKLPSYWHGSDA